MISEEVAVFDNLKNRLHLIVMVESEDEETLSRAELRLDQLEKKLKENFEFEEFSKPNDSVEESDFVSSFGEKEFKSAVNKVKEYIKKGDVMQVVCSQRMSIPFNSDPVALYRAIRYLNPSPYMYYLNLKDFHIVGSSPEILARLEDGDVTVRPIAGTRRRGKNKDDDKAMAMDVFKATFPAGTVSGAPKVRAMEIIDEFEPVKRGIYGGAVGYLSWQGNMDMAIAIRTAVIKDDLLYIQAGGGWVADSIPELEWKEVLNKGRVIFKAAEMVQEKLKG